MGVKVAKMHRAHVGSRCMPPAWAQRGDEVYINTLHTRKGGRRGPRHVPPPDKAEVAGSACSRTSITTGSCVSHRRT
eukprot:scaffold69739_cov30-Tisochrysis_lutea.AAC.1